MARPTSQDVSSEIAEEAQKVVTTHVNNFIAQLSQKSSALGNKALSTVGFTPKASETSKTFLEKWIQNGKLRLSIEGTAMTLPSVAEVAKAASNYAVTEKNLEAQEHLNDSKLWGVIAKTEQGSWQGTQDVLSMLQDYHTQGVTQATSILQSHHQAAMRAIQFNKA